MSNYITPTKNLTISTTYKPTNSLYYSATLPSTARVSSSYLKTSPGQFEDTLKDIKRRYETEAKNVQHNYEVDYNNHVTLIKKIEELEALLDEERNRTYEIEVKYNGAISELDKERRLRKEYEQEITVLKDKFRKAEVLINEQDLELQKAHQDNSRLSSENNQLRAEIQRLTDLYNSKLREIEDKYLAQITLLSSDIERLKIQIEQLRASYESKLQGIERDSHTKFARYEERIRDQERIITEFEAEIRKKNDQIAQLKIHYEEELRRQISIIREEEKYKYESMVKSFEIKLNQLQEERDALFRKTQELSRELIVKEKQIQDLRTQYESDLGQYKMEINELRRQISTLSSDIEKLRHELANEEAIIRRLESEISNLEREVQRLKEVHASEISRITNDHNVERRRWDEAERTLKAKIEELERYVRSLETENHKLKADIERLKEMITGNVQKTIFQTFQTFQSFPSYDITTSTTTHNIKPLY